MHSGGRRSILSTFTLRKAIVAIGDQWHWKFSTGASCAAEISSHSRNRFDDTEPNSKNLISALLQEMQLNMHFCTRMLQHTHYNIVSDILRALMHSGNHKLQAYARLSLVRYNFHKHAIGRHDRLVGASSTKPLGDHQSRRCVAKFEGSLFGM